MVLVVEKSLARQTQNGGIFLPKDKNGNYLIFPFPKFYVIFQNAYLKFPNLHLHARFI
jgi:hypothetical protein